MKKLLLFLLIFGVWLQTHAQQAILQERNYLIKTTNTEITASAIDGQGNILFAGTTWITPSLYDHTFLMVKPNTDTIWSCKGMLPLDFPLITLKYLPSSGFIFGGNIINNNIRATMLQKVSSTNSLLWTQKPSTIQNQTNTLLPLPNKDLILGGWYGQKNFAFTRTDSMGNVKWSKGYPWGMINEAMMDMNFTQTGNIISAGITDKPFGPAHIKLMLVNQNGDSLKGKQLIVTDPSRTETMTYSFSSVTPLSDGGFLVTAALDTITTAAPGGSYMGMVVKVDSSFNVQWHYVHRTPATEEYKFTKAKELTDGTILVLGFKIRPIATGNLNGFQLYRFNPTGQLKNIYPFTSNICSQVWGLTFDALADSTFMIGGRCGNNPPVSFGFYVAKVKVANLPPVVPPFNVPAITGTKEETLLAGTSLGQSYPNPTTSEATIPYSLPQNYHKASIQIREIATGREIRKYDLKRNSSSLTINIANMSSGLYLYNLVVDEKPVATKKLAVMH